MSRSGDLGISISLYGLLINLVRIYRLGLGGYLIYLTLDRTIVTAAPDPGETLRARIQKDLYNRDNSLKDGLDLAMRTSILTE